MNSVSLLGRLVRNPEHKVTDDELSIAKFTLAINRSNAQDQADFIDITAFKKTAEFVCKYFEKGQLVAVEGSIRTNNYTDKNGNKKTSFEVMATKVHFAERKRDSQQNSKGSNNDFIEVDANDDLPL